MPKQPLDLAVSDVGAWVVMPDGRTGQVWALGGYVVTKGQRVTTSARAKGSVVNHGGEATVWVATGAEYVECPVAALRFASDDSAEQGVLDFGEVGA